MIMERRVLLVDDDAALRQSLAEQLKLHGEFSITEAETADAALDIAKHQSFHACWMSACPAWTGASSAGSCAAAKCKRPF